MSNKNDMARLASILGSQRAITKALGLTPAHVSRVVNGKSNCTAEISALVEFLEAVPRKDWPQRWIDATEAE